MNRMQELIKISFMLKQVLNNSKSVYGLDELGCLEIMGWRIENLQKEAEQNPQHSPEFINSVTVFLKEEENKLKVSEQKDR